MRISIFKIGLVLVIVGSIWIGVVFQGGEKIQSETILRQNASFEMSVDFDGKDIGFYKILMPEFGGEEIFVQILDTGENVIGEEVVQTKMSVGYFDHTGGTYTIRIANVSENSISIDTELGDTNSSSMAPAGILILAGSIAMMIMSYVRLYSYNMAQPDENNL